MGEYAKGLPDFDRAIELGPNNTGYLGGRSLTYAALGRYADALTDIQRAISITPQDPDLLGLEMFLQVRMGEWEEAAETASAITSQTSEMVQRQQGELAKLSPEIAQRRMESLFSSLGLDVPTAQTEAIHWLGIMAGEPAVAVRALEAEIYGVQGLGHSEAGQTTVALTDFSRAINLDPDNLWLRQQRGLLHFQLGQYDAALADFDWAIKLQPSNATLLAGRSVIYATLNRYSDALSDIQQAINIAPLDPNLRGWEMVVRSLAGEWDKAADTASTISEQISEMVGFWQQRFKGVPQGIALQRAQSILSVWEPNTQASQAEASRLLGILTGKPEAAARILLAEIVEVQGVGHAQTGDTVAALAAFSGAIELAPDNAMLLRRRGETYFQLGQFEQALADFDRAIALQPGNSRAIAFRGETYRQMSEFAKALTDFDRAVALEPDDAWVLAQHARLTARWASTPKLCPTSTAPSSSSPITPGPLPAKPWLTSR